MDDSDLMYFKNKSADTGSTSGTSAASTDNTDFNIHTSPEDYMAFLQIKKYNFYDLTDEELMREPYLGIIKTYVQISKKRKFYRGFINPSPLQRAKIYRAIDKCTQPKLRKSGSSSEKLNLKRSKSGDSISVSGGASESVATAVAASKSPRSPVVERTLNTEDVNVFVSRKGIILSVCKDKDLCSQLFDRYLNQSDNFVFLPPGFENVAEEDCVYNRKLLSYFVANEELDATMLLMNGSENFSPGLKTYTIFLSLKVECQGLLALWKQYISGGIYRKFTTQLKSCHAIFDVFSWQYQATFRLLDAPAGSSLSQLRATAAHDTATNPPRTVFVEVTVKCNSKTELREKISQIDSVESSGSPYNTIILDRLVRGTDAGFGICRLLDRWDVLPLVGSNILLVRNAIQEPESSSDSSSNSDSDSSSSSENSNTSAHSQNSSAKNSGSESEPMHLDFNLVEYNIRQILCTSNIKIGTGTAGSVEAFTQMDYSKMDKYERASLVETPGGPNGKDARWYTFLNLYEAMLDKKVDPVTRAPFPEEYLEKLENLNTVVRSKFLKGYPIARIEPALIMLETNYDNNPTIHFYIKLDKDPWSDGTFFWEIPDLRGTIYTDTTELAITTIVNKWSDKTIFNDFLITDDPLLLFNKKALYIFEKNRALFLGKSDLERLNSELTKQIQLIITHVF